MLERPAQDFDVYDVVESQLHADVDWQYLSPDESILGMTAFSDEVLEVYTDEGVLPHRVMKRIRVAAGTILIERALSEDEKRKGQENFTVMHEAFHLLLHGDFFRALLPDAYSEHQRVKAHYGANGHRKLETALDFVEWQADTCAACFLMPENAVRKAFCRMQNKFQRVIPQNQLLQGIVLTLSDCFHVSRQAMTYRLQDLQLLRGNI